jgi:hypothetical protein
MDTSAMYGLDSYTLHILDAQQLRRGVTFLNQSRGTWEQDVLQVNFHMNLNHNGNCSNHLYDISDQSVKCA